MAGPIVEPPILRLFLCPSEDIFFSELLIIIKLQEPRMEELQKTSTVTYKPVPSPLKKEFQDHKVTIGAVARYIGRSYIQTCHYLNGVVTPPAEMETKMDI